MPKDSEAKFSKDSLPLVLIVLGMVLIGCSFLPVGDFRKEQLWTAEDAAKLSALREKYHETSYATPERLGLSKEELAEQRKRMKQSIESSTQRLENARNQTALWSRYLLWSGVLATAVGTLWHKALTG